MSIKTKERERTNQYITDIIVKPETYITICGEEAQTCVFKYMYVGVHVLAYEFA